MATTRKTAIGVMHQMLAFACAMQWLAQSLGEPKASAPQQDGAYRIGPRAVIDIRVDEAPELSLTTVVKADGTFLMPYLSRLQAQGKTPEALSHEIADRLRGKYLKAPHLLVIVNPFNHRTFFIMGAVKKPGVYQVAHNLSLWELISLAGGLVDKYGPTAYILRQHKPSSALPNSSKDDDPEYDTITVNIDDLLKGKHMPGLYLEPGDIVNIPMADAFYVVGEVKAPGPLRFSKGITLRQAISLTQGFTLNANAKEGVIFRTDPMTGRRQEIKVDINAVMRSKAPDIPIQPNDVIIVPNVRPKTINHVFRRLDNLLPPLWPPCRKQEPCIT
jgi:protein involved in polysaccharide export with SLBB domain